MPEVTKSKYLVNAGWDDVPHLSEERKAQMLEGTIPYLRDARSKGTPSLGSGAIFPIPREEIVVPPMALPSYWPRAYALDVGWKRTAALWGALDRTSDILYIYTEHYRAEAQPTIHAAAIKARGEWIQGSIDPAANSRGQKDGEQLMALYRELGLHLINADNAVESGLYAVWERLSTGRLKFFSSCTNLLNEYVLYRRDDKGKIVKVNDHLMDCLRYLVASCPSRFIVQPVQKDIIIHDVVGDTDAGY